jgi:hypothetical protein
MIAKRPYTRAYCEVRIGIEGTTIATDDNGHCGAEVLHPDDIIVEVIDPLDDVIVGVPIQDMVDAWFLVVHGVPREHTGDST